MGRISPLATTRFKQAAFAEQGEHIIKQALFGVMVEQAVTKFAQHRGIEAAIIKLKRKRIFPVDAASHGISGLLVRQALYK